MFSCQRNFTSTDDYEKNRDICTFFEGDEVKNSYMGISLMYSFSSKSLLACYYYSTYQHTGFPLTRANDDVFLHVKVLPSCCFLVRQETGGQFRGAPFHDADAPKRVISAVREYQGRDDKR